MFSDINSQFRIIATFLILVLQVIYFTYKQYFIYNEYNNEQLAYLMHFHNLSPYQMSHA
jgi:lysophospholipid acyltransferase (LPLAT)-like uncharacterized protein